jgi:hypothetical protein
MTTLVELDGAARWFGSGHTGKSLSEAIMVRT